MSHVNKGGDTTQQVSQKQDTVMVELDDDKETPESKFLQQQINPIPPDETPPPASTHTDAPILCSVDRVNSALPQKMMMSVDNIRMATRYSKSEPLIKHIKNLSKQQQKSCKRSNLHWGRVAHGYHVQPLYCNRRNHPRSLFCRQKILCPAHLSIKKSYLLPLASMPKN